MGGFYEKNNDGLYSEFVGFIVLDRNNNFDMYVDRFSNWSIYCLFFGIHRIRNFKNIFGYNSIVISWIEKAYQKLKPKNSRQNNFAWSLKKYKMEVFYEKNDSKRIKREMD